MKRKLMLGAAVAVVLLVVSPGVSPAGDRMNRSASPEFGTWEYWMAEETGNLPGSEPNSLSSRIDNPRRKTAPGSGHDSWEYQIGG